MNIFVKISEVLQHSGDKVSYDMSAYRARIDEIYETFGADRVLYGSDWPNSDLLGPYPKVLGVVRAYFAAKGREASEKYFWKNSLAAYKWIKQQNTFAFYTSRAGMIENLDYRGNSYNATFPACNHPEHHKV